MWLLDTNAWIRYLNSVPSLVKTRVHNQQLQQILIGDIVKAELYFGAYKSQYVEQNLALLDTLFAQFVSLSFNEKVAQIFGQIRTDLTRRGMVIGPYDLQIAAIALANDVTLVTHNIREFSRVAELKIEDWET